jgi:hypothetical protein
LIEPEDAQEAGPENQTFSSPLAAVAIQLNETFEELKNAGFTQREALHIVSHLLTSLLSYDTGDYAVNEQDENDEEEDTDDGENYF